MVQKGWCCFSLTFSSSPLTPTHTHTNTLTPGVIKIIPSWANEIQNHLWPANFSSVTRFLYKSRYLIDGACILVFVDWEVFLSFFQVFLCFLSGFLTRSCVYYPRTCLLLSTFLFLSVLNLPLRVQMHNKPHRHESHLFQRQSTRKTCNPSLCCVFSALLISTLMSQCRNFSYVFRWTRKHCREGS